MPAKKPKDKHRIRFKVTCSTEHKELVDKSLANIQPRLRSKYILSLIKKAISERLAEGEIASKNTSIVEKPPIHRASQQFQISCTPQEMKLIDDFCDRYLDKYKRSRWIVKLIVDK